MLADADDDRDRVSLRRWDAVEDALAPIEMDCDEDVVALAEADAEVDIEGDPLGVELDEAVRDDVPVCDRLRVRA